MLTPVAPTTRRPIAIQATVFALAWLVVAGAEPGSWLIGLPTVALALITAASDLPTAMWESRRRPTPSRMLQARAVNREERFRGDVLGP